MDAWRSETCTIVRSCTSTATGDRRGVRGRGRRRFSGADPCARNVLLTVIDIVRTGARRPTARRRASGGSPTPDAVVGAASWTPPHDLLVSVDAAGRRGRPRRGRMLERATALGIQPRRCQSAPRLGARGRGGMDGRHGRHHRTRPADPAQRARLAHRRAGTARRRAGPGVDGDVPLLAAWLEAFSAEIEHVAPANSRAMADHMVRAGHARPLGRRRSGSSAWSATGTLPGSLRVGPVYTPPEHRNHGYARRLTYEVTAVALERPGRRPRHALHRCSQSCLELDLPAGRLSAARRARGDRVREAERRSRALESAP